MDFLNLLDDAVSAEDGKALAELFDMKSPYKLTNVPPGPWAKITADHFRAKQAWKQTDYKEAFESKTESIQAFLLLFQSMTKWILPVLYQFNKQLLQIATEIGGDALDECCRTLNKSFSICLTDRYNEYDESRKWGTIYIANLLFKSYFKQQSLSLCTNMLKSMESAHLPNLGEFPMSHQVTFKYYTGILHFYNDEFEKCCQDLEFARSRTSGLIKLSAKIVDKPSNHNQTYFFLIHNRQILDFLIPALVLQGKIPQDLILMSFQPLFEIYAPLMQAIKTGNLNKWDNHLETYSSQLLKKGTYLNLERCRILVIRELFKKVHSIYGKSFLIFGETRISFEKFRKALEISMGQDSVSIEFVECCLVNMIDKGICLVLK
jgi:hypothetical protein